MSRYRSDPESLDLEKPGACDNFLRYTWKTIRCIFSHATLISMVVSYCWLGAVTFESLELDHEIEVKKSIRYIRENTTAYLWNFTNKSGVLHEEDFIPVAEKYLKEFENSLLKSMARDGWDGDEDPSRVQWTTSGALFYSIVVITTIGYGHITPKTNWGKVVTIFYAILGIPLMLLCLSNIGDIMATSFRFLYWRVCCYVCQKKPKKRQRRRSFKMTVKTDSRLSRSKSANSSFRRPARASGKSGDSGYGVSENGPAYHSDTELRYPDEFNHKSRAPKVPSSRPNRYSEPTKSAPNHRSNNLMPSRGSSLDRRNKQAKELELDPVLLADIPILCNRYVIGAEDIFTGRIPARRAVSAPRTSHHYLQLPLRSFTPESSSDREDQEVSKTRRKVKPKRARSPIPNSSPKMMTPLGYGQKTKYLDDPSDSEDEYSNNPYYEPEGKVKPRPVPIWLCVLLVVGYILAGAFLFQYWENWNYLDAAYFCFITLTTIGFGDLVPAKRVTNDSYVATVSIALCSLYLLFGISLLAMSFNLVQEEVISNVKTVAKTLGIIKSDSDDSEEEI